MGSRKRILIIDDEENMRHMLSHLLRKGGFDPAAVADGRAGVEAAAATAYDFILCDVRMPGMDGLSFLDEFCRLNLTSTVIMMSAYGTVETAIACMKRGAYDYISKPFNQDEIFLVLRKADEREHLKEENRRLRAELAVKRGFGEIVTQSKIMQEILSLVARVSDLKTTVLILGESGTGKELIARAIHQGSSRAEEPFVAVNCGAIPENLLESELFGHVRGAFTDAVAEKKGLFETAEGGTLFLDEIGDMSPALQVKLLRALQEGEIRRIGSSEARSVDVRMISATSKDLQSEVVAGRFREDLYYRLNVFSIELPPLRDRREDIALLAAHFLEKHAAMMSTVVPRVSPEAAALLEKHEWPGNVRELENMMERALVLCDGRNIIPDDLPHRLRQRPTGAVSLPDDCLSVKKAQALLERRLIARALDVTNGNRTHAAKMLEISHRALLYKLKEYGIE